MKNNPQWLQWAVELQSLAQTGLAYCKDVYDGEQKTDKIAEELVNEADLSQGSQDVTKTSYGFASFTSKHVETIDGDGMTFALRFNYIKGVILYTIICAVILTAILLPIWICRDRKSMNSYY